jgi:hypothetical protein
MPDLKGQVLNEVMYLSKNRFRGEWDTELRLKNVTGKNDSDEAQ